VLKEEQIVVEAKITRDGLGERQIADQLIDDIERYRSHPDCRTLVEIVFDPDGRIPNPRGLESDLRRDGTDFRVRVVVCR
jgi:REase_DpnII-MboI